MIVRSTLTVIERVRGKFRSRALEWEHTIVGILWGLLAVYSPDAFSSRSYNSIVSLPFPMNQPDLWGWTAILIGLIRVVALCVNGYMIHSSSIVRALGITLGILMFSAISFGILFSWHWSTALAVYPVMAFFGLFSLTWVISDVANPNDH